MGEIAEMMLEGILCECCGEFIGNGDGYPQYCRNCDPKRHHKTNRKCDQIKKSKKQGMKDKLEHYSQIVVKNLKAYKIADNHYRLDDWDIYPHRGSMRNMKTKEWKSICQFEREINVKA